MALHFLYCTTLQWNKFTATTTITSLFCQSISIGRHNQLRHSLLFSNFCATEISARVCQKVECHIKWYFDITALLVFTLYFKVGVSEQDYHRMEDHTLRFQNLHVGVIYLKNKLAIIWFFIAVSTYCKWVVIALSVFLLELILCGMLIF